MGVQGIVSGELRKMLRQRVAAVFENTGFEEFFDRIGKFHAGVGEKLYAVVREGIVGSGDDHASFKVVLAHEAGDAGRGEDASEGNGGAGLGETGGQDGGDVLAGLAGVHADEDAGNAVFAE